jgi:hypothetical protein
MCPGGCHFQPRMKLPIHFLLKGKPLQVRVRELVRVQLVVNITSIDTKGWRAIRHAGNCGETLPSPASPGNRAQGRKQPVLNFAGRGSSAESPEQSAYPAARQEPCLAQKTLPDPIVPEAPRPRAVGHFPQQPVPCEKRCHSGKHVQSQPRRAADTDSF